MSRKLLFALIAAAVAASAAAAAVSVRWTVLESGMTESSTTYSPQAYLAVTKSQEARFSSRLDPSGRAAVSRINLQRTGIVAVFLDGIPCARDARVAGVSRIGSALVVAVHWTRPPVGMAMCVRIGTPYFVVGVSRATLGHPVPAHVRVVAIARP